MRQKDISIHCYYYRHHCSLRIRSASSSNVKEDRWSAGDDMMTVTKPVEAEEGEGANPFIRLDPGMLSRLVYANPVCVLTTRSSSADGIFLFNAMVISWLMPADNAGTVVLSMNARRHSAKAMSILGSPFLLSMARAGMESLLLRIGSCSGADVNKFDFIETERKELFGMARTRPQSKASSSNKRTKLAPKAERKRMREMCEDEMASWSGIPAGCAGHAMCTVEHVDASRIPGHLLITAKLRCGWARSSYWKKGKILAPESGDPPLLAFAGSKHFLHMQS